MATLRIPTGDTVTLLWDNDGEAMKVEVRNVEGNLDVIVLDAYDIGTGWATFFPKGSNRAEHCALCLKPVYLSPEANPNGSGPAWVFADDNSVECPSNYDYPGLHHVEVLT